jgi:Cu(I)/Ag(I) efflux system membrane fusion protein
MSRARTTLIAAALASALAGGAFYLGRSTAPHAPEPTAAAGATAPSGERKVLYWHDPMVPGQRFDKPGKSPFMDMPLQPVYADEASDSGVKVSPQVQQNLGIRTAPVTRAQVASSFDAVGTVAFDERLNVAVQTRVLGYVERLSVRAPMERVSKGQALATVFAPEWLGPLNELVALKRAGAASELLEAARERTRAMSIPSELVRQAEEGMTPQARYTLVSPASGVVAELGVREGVQVAPGMTLFRVAGLEKVWAVAEVPEAQAVRLVRGQKVKAVLQADPSFAFDGEMKEILPQVIAATRTMQARFEVDNRAGKLTPGMLLRLQVAGPTASRLVVPAEAVIRTGTRAVAIVRRDDGPFEPREVRLGADLGDSLEVLEGLTEGEQVVASGQFLIDSEARLRSVLGAMQSPQTPPPAQSPSPPSPQPTPAHQHGEARQSAPVAATYAAQGKVESVDADSLTISHGPVPELKWPGMTMGFGKPAPGDFADIKAGDQVRFEFRKGGPLDYELVSVRRTGSAK